MGVDLLAVFEADFDSSVPVIIFFVRGAYREREKRTSVDCRTLQLFSIGIVFLRGYAIFGHGLIPLETTSSFVSGTGCWSVCFISIDIYIYIYICGEK